MSVNASRATSHFSRAARHAPGTRPAAGCCAGSRSPERPPHALGRRRPASWAGVRASELAVNVVVKDRRVSVSKVTVFVVQLQDPTLVALHGSSLNRAADEAAQVSDTRCVRVRPGSTRERKIAIWSAKSTLFIWQSWRKSRRRKGFDESWMSCGPVHIDQRKELLTRIATLCATACYSSISTSECSSPAWTDGCSSATSARWRCPGRRGRAC